MTCPICRASSTWDVLGAGSVCPSCGNALSATGVAENYENDANVGEDALVHELRAAFAPAAEGEPPPNGLLANARPRSGRSAYDLPAGTVIGDFEVLEELGRGGMGVVYRARQISLGREVALKVLPGYAARAPQAVQRFQAEAQAAARLHHTNIVAVYAQGEENGHFYYAMELIRGTGLDVVIRSRPELLSSGRLPSPVERGDSGRLAGESSAPRLRTGLGGRVPRFARRGWRRRPRIGETATTPRVARSRADYRHIATLFAGVADALECAHRGGVLHRDIKPHNLLLSDKDRLHVTDFGLARLLDAPHLTQSGEVVGTPAYLAPEQVSGRPDAVDHRADLYALGVTLYEVLTEAKPFPGARREEFIHRLLHDEPVRPRRLDPRIPVDLETICLRAIEKDPARRHPSAAVLAEDLRRFADQRPILSRRTAWLQRVWKWARRNPARAAAIGMAAAVLVLAGGLVLSVVEQRRARGQQLVDDAYERLAYVDYRSSDTESTHLQPALALGAEPAAVALCRALVAMGGARWAEAIAQVRAVEATRPDDPVAGYILAWALHENGDLSAARDALERAEAVGLPQTADGWFFRGLALHRSDPEEAIRSYRQANALRAREGQFYPQAVLHLARARNQRLYTHRTQEGFEESVKSLEQLVANQHYGAYPYYLLSIAWRLYAEIHSVADGSPGGLGRMYYANAGDWARRGQEADPTDVNVIMAEAECLESIEDFEGAIVVRTRALELSRNKRQRLENLHYRWRLYYWTDQLDQALADLEELPPLAADSRMETFLYRQVYPALVLAERGELRQAEVYAHEIAGNEPKRALAVLWSATCLRLLGKADKATALLEAHTDIVDYSAGLVPPQTRQWVRALCDMARTDADPDPLVEQAATVASAAKPGQEGGDSDIRTVSAGSAARKLWAEACFHAGAARLAAGDRVAAREYFRRAYRSYDDEARYTYHGKLLFVRMKNSLAWPAWISVSSDAAEDAHVEFRGGDLTREAGKERP